MFVQMGGIDHRGFLVAKPYGQTAINRTDGFERSVLPQGMVRIMRAMPR